MSILDIFGTGDKQERSTMLFKQLTAEAEALLAEASPASRPEIERVYEALRYTDPVSTDVLREVNMKIQREFTDFKAAVADQDLAEIRKIETDLLDAIRERSIICKATK